MPTYITVDNIWDPFKVVISGDLVTVYKSRKDGGETPVFHPKPFRTFRSLKTFIGSHPDYPKLRGNSFLLQVEPERYVYIGGRMGIYSFQASGGIRRYNSNVGNGATPYPYAVGKNYTYLLLEQRYVKNSEIPWGEDPYEVFYSLTAPKKAEKAKLLESKYPKFRIRQITPGTR